MPRKDYVGRGSGEASNHDGGSDLGVRQEDRPKQADFVDTWWYTFPRMKVHCDGAFIWNVWRMLGYTILTSGFAHDTLSSLTSISSVQAALPQHL